MRIIVYECDARTCEARVEVHSKTPPPPGWVEVQTHAIQFHRPVEANPRAVQSTLAPFVLCPEHGRAFLGNFKGRAAPAESPPESVGRLPPPGWKQR